MRRVRCPHCNGSGGAMYYCTGDEGVPGSSGPQPYPCHLCDGDGRLSELHSYLLLAGRRLQRYRLKRGITVVQMAAEVGIEPGDVQCMEAGNFSLPVVVKGYKPEVRGGIEGVMAVMAKATQ